MDKRKHLLILVMLFMVSLFSGLGGAEECIKGARTILKISRINVPLVPRHGQTIGQTKFVLCSEPGGVELLSSEFEGRWFCLGFNKNTKTYVVGGIMERGAWLPLGSIRYLSEDGGSFEQSAFDRLDYLAMTTVTSPGGRYIVFIGGQNTTGILYVLDSERDIIRELGPAPAPPPNELASDVCNGEPFEWGTCWGDGYVEMDKGILRFRSEGILEVSYGNDGPSARVKTRRIRRFDLGS